MRAVKKAVSVIIISCMMLMSIFMQAAYAGNDYPSKYRGMQVPDEWNFYTSNCTSFAAWCLNSRNKVGFHNYFGGRLWGHAKQWGHTARALGYTVDKNPAVGSIAWWENGTYGHVAWVSAVNGANVTIEEYNFRNWLGYGERVINQNNPAGYIHIQDLKAAEPEKPKPIEGNYYSDSSVEDGEYIIESSIRDNVVMTVDGKKYQDGENIFVMQNNNWDTQIWKLTRLPDNTFQVLSKGHNRVLDVSEYKIGNEANIHAWSWVDGANQHWYIMKNSDGTYSFFAKHSGYALDVKGGVLDEGAAWYSNLWQYTPNGTKAQKFRLKRVDKPVYREEEKPVEKKEEYKPKKENPKYTVTFKDYDGRTISSQTVEKYNSASTPASPYREGYQFNGWDREYSNITSNLTVYAKYIKLENNNINKSEGAARNNLQKWNPDQYDEDDNIVNTEAGKLEYNLRTLSDLKYSAKVTTSQMEEALEKFDRDDDSEAEDGILNLDLSAISGDFNSLNISMSKEAFGYMVDGDIKSLQINLPKNKLMIDGTLLEAIYDFANGKRITFAIKKTVPKVSKKAKNLEEYNNLYAFDIKVGKKKIKKLDEGGIYVDNPFYKLSKKELKKHLIWFK